MKIRLLTRTSLVVLACLLVFCIGCNNKNEAVNNGQTDQKKTEQLDKENTDVTIIDNEFIVSFSDAYISRLEEKMSPSKVKPESYEERTQRLKDFVAAEFGEKLSGFDKDYDIFGATSVCFFVRLKKKATTEEIRKLFSGEQVENVTNNHTLKITFPPAKQVASCPDGEMQWGVKRVSNSSKPNGNYKAAWVIDSGIAVLHPDLNVDLLLSRSFVTGEDISDYIGHGTHVAGIIGAKADGKGMVGVSPNAPIRALKILSKDGGTADDYVEALQFVKDNSSKAEILNLSFGGPKIPAAEKLIKSIADKGVFVVAAAGNDSQSVDGTVYPAAINYKNVVTISSIDDSDTFAKDSNYGAESLDFAAPGVNICSTAPGTGYATDSGTSFAAPHVAGLILVLGKLPNQNGTAKNDPDGKFDPIAHE